MSKAKAMSDRERTNVLRSALRSKYEDPIRYALLEEVANGTGFTGRGWADAVLLELWPSDGLHLIGFEIKASRADWKRELDNPAKCENIARYCDGWIVVAPSGVVPTETVPEAWGLWEFNLEKETWHYAKKYTPRAQPKYIPRPFFAALLRRAQRSLPAPQYIAQAVTAARNEADRVWRRDKQHMEQRIAQAEARASKMSDFLHAEGYVQDYSARGFRKRDAA